MIDLSLDTARSILAGKAHLVSHPGSGQYAQQGASSCGLAALNCARCLLSKAQLNTQPAEDFLQSLATSESVEEIMSICNLWTSTLHLEVEDIAKIPWFSHSLKHVRTDYGACNANAFERRLSLQFAGRRTPAAAILTRPPEILACLFFPLPTTALYLLFDSHPRPEHPLGSGMLFSTSLYSIALHLGGLLSVDPALLTGSTWEAQFLAQFSSHLFIPCADQDTGSSDTSRRLLLESSLASMEMRSRLRDMESRIGFLTRENARLEAEVAASTQKQVTNSKSPIPQKSFFERATGKRETRQNSSPSSARNYANAVAGPSKPRDTIDRTPKAKMSTPSKTSDLAESGSDWLFLEFNSQGGVRQLELSPALDPNDPEYATRLKEWYNPTDHSSPPPPTSKTVTTAPSASSSDQLYALREQQRYTDEHLCLQAERSALACLVQATFKCGICMDVLIEDMIVRVPSCKHTFCRDCLKSYVSLKLKEHRFPILCPQCTTGDVNLQGSEPSAIDNLLAQQIGINEEENAVWHELELSRVSVLLSCRKCQRSAFVDREEHDLAKLIVCPLPGCHYLWCKTCQQEVQVEAPMHSCDGTSELDHLMKTQGWKYCPGCRTPIQKTTGCNHMMCLSPGCNMHFCYLCGGTIIQSGLRSAIQGAVTAHYRVCMLFEVPN